MRKVFFAFLLTLGVILPVYARHAKLPQQWHVVFTGGQVDPNGNTLTTTEVRGSTGHVIPNGLSLPDGTTCSSASSSWNGTTGCVIWAVFTGTQSDPAHGPGMVMIWSKSPKAGGVPYRDLLMQPGDNQNTIVYDKCWNTYSNGSAITGGNFCTLFSSGWRQDGSTILRGYWRNDNQPSTPWGYTTITSGLGFNVGPQVRGGSSHKDFALGTPTDYMFLAAEPYGPYRASLNVGTTATTFCGGTGCGVGGGASTVTYTLEDFNGCTGGVGVCTNLATDWAGCTGEALSGITLVNNGSGYSVGDDITFAGGVFNTAATVHVTAVSGGNISAFTVSNAGSYLTLYSAITWTQGSTTGSGTGATFNNATYTSLNGALCPIFSGASQIRPMAMADVTIGSAAHPTLCLTVGYQGWCRTDGSSPTWVKRWQIIASEITGAHSQSELRGLTAIPNPSGPGQILFMTTEGGPDYPYTVDPNTWTVTNEKPSGGLIGTIQASPLWSLTDYGYTITTYNQLIGTWNGVLVWGFGAIYYTTATSPVPINHAFWQFHRATSTLDSAAWFMTRTLGVSPVYTVYSIPNITPQSQISARWCAPSVFPDSQGPPQTLDCMGVDANQATQVNTGWVEEFRGEPFTNTTPAPTLTSMSPTEVGPAGQNTVTLTGTNLTGASCPTFNGISGTSCVVVNSTTVTANTPVITAGGPYNVSIVTSGGAATLTSALKVIPVRQTFHPGDLDTTGLVRLGGTETRGLARHPFKNGTKMQKTGASTWATCSSATSSWDGVKCWGVALGTGFWADSNCSTNDQGIIQGPQINLLVSAQGAWTNDLNLNDTCNGANFDVNNALESLPLIYDGSGGVLTGEILAASDAGSLIYMRDDTTGTWTSVNPSGTGGIRSLRNIKDTSQTTNACADGLCRDWVIAGQGVSGLAAFTKDSGTFTFTNMVNTHSGNGSIRFSVDGTEGNLCATQTLDACTNLDSQWTGLVDVNGCAVAGKIVQGCLVQSRILSIVSCPTTFQPNADGNGLYATVGWQIWRVILKGTATYAVLWNEAQNSVVEFNTQQNGFRGMSCIPNGAGGWLLLTHAQVQGDMIAFDPNTQMTLSPPGGYGGVTENNTRTCMQAIWSGVGQGSRITGYNGGEMFRMKNSILIGMGNSEGTANTRPSFVGEDVVPGIWIRPYSGQIPGTCYGLYPASPGTTNAPPPLLAALVPNACGNGSTCTSGYNGDANPAQSIIDNTTVDGNGYARSAGSTRTLVCSPFPEDGATIANGNCGQAIFFGGRDGEKAIFPSHNTAWAEWISVDSSMGIP